MLRITFDGCRRRGGRSLNDPAGRPTRGNKHRPTDPGARPRPQAAARRSRATIRGRAARVHGRAGGLLRRLRGRGRQPRQRSHPKHARLCRHAGSQAVLGSDDRERRAPVPGGLADCRTAERRVRPMPRARLALAHAAARPPRRSFAVAGGGVGDGRVTVIMGRHGRPREEPSGRLRQDVSRRPRRKVSRRPRGKVSRRPREKVKRRPREELGGCRRGCRLLDAGRLDGRLGRGVCTERPELGDEVARRCLDQGHRRLRKIGRRRSHLPRIARPAP
jgi:hypothetical protein